MIAIVTIVVMALAGSSLMYMSRKSIMIQQQRRVAAELARYRIETLAAGGYNALTNLPSSGTSNYTVGPFTFAVTTAYTNNSSPPYRVISVGVPYPVTLPVQGTATISTVFADLD